MHLVLDLTVCTFVCCYLLLKDIIFQNIKAKKWAIHDGSIYVLKRTCSDESSH